MRHGRVILIAHRGASKAAPENTCAAIRIAMAQRADMVELDVQLTSDHRLVIFHDDRLERTTTGRGFVRNRRYRDLARLDAGSWFSSRFAGEPIPLVSQALRLIPKGRAANLELKRTPRKRLVVRQLIKCLERTRMIRRVLISSFDPSLLALVNARRPRIASALLCRRDARRALRQAIRLGCSALHPHASLVSPSLMAQAHAQGLTVNVWTVDSAQQVRRLIRMGVDGIVTNVPDRLRRVVP